MTTATPYVQKPNDEKFAVVLPCDQKDFGRFISGLLGKPQTIERSFFGVFEITPDDITNTFHLVEQRIHQQNEASLIQFTVKVHYHDESSVSHNSLEDFIHYREVRPLIPTVVQLTWTYLIKFRDKDVPEKQTIEMSFGSKSESDYLSFQRHRHGYMGTEGRIYVRVSHTARTWASDVESLLAGHIKTLLQSENRFRSFTTRNSGWIGFVFGVIFFLLTLGGSFWISKSVSTSQIEAAQLILSNASVGSISVAQKVDFLLTQYAEGVWARFYFGLAWFIVSSFIVAIFIGTWVGESASNEPSSFVLFTQKAKELRKEYLKRSRKKLIMLLLSMTSSVIVGVMANFIFAVISSKLLVK